MIPSDSAAGIVAAQPNAAGIRPVSKRDFAQFRDLLLQETGVLLTDSKRELLIARLSKRVRALGLPTFTAYFDRVVNDGHERAEMIDRLMTNETKFFREPLQFDYLEKTIVPAWLEAGRIGQRARRVRIWSAGCSTGQEPTSIAMVLLSMLPGWDIEIFATDVSTQALREASAGVWPIEKAGEIPPQHLRNFMLRGVRSHAGVMRSGDPIRSVLHFRRLNLNGPIPEVGSFDAVFCRNVLIYFEAEARRRVIDKLIARLAPNGYLFLGHAESLLNTSHRLQTAAPSVYKRSHGELS